MLAEQLIRHFMDVGAMSSTVLNKDLIESTLWELKDFTSTKDQMKKIADLRAQTLEPAEVMILSIASVFGDLPFTEADIIKFQWDLVLMPDNRHGHVAKMEVEEVAEVTRSLKSRSFISLADPTSLIGKASYMHAKMSEASARRKEISQRSADHGKGYRGGSEFHHYILHNPNVISTSILHNNLPSISSVHSKFASYLETVSRHDLPPHYAEIAHHHVLGNNKRKAQRFLLMAGDDAVAMCAPHEALNLFNQFLKLVDEKKVMRDKVGQRGGEGSEVTHEIDTHGRKKGRRNTFFSISGKDQCHELGHIHRMMGEACYYIGGFEESVKHLETALTYFGPAPGASIFRGSVTSSRTRKCAYIIAKFLKVRERVYGTLMSIADVTFLLLPMPPPFLTS